MERELQGHILAQHGDIGLCGTFLHVVPIGSLVRRVECIAHLIIVAVDVPALDMYLQVIIIRQPACLGLVAALPVRCVKGVHHVVDTVVGAVGVRGYHVESFVQLYAIGIAARLAMPGV